MEVLIKPIIEKDAEDGGGDGGDEDVAPFQPDGLLLFGGLVFAERTEVTEEIDDDRHDGRELDDDEEEFEEITSLSVFKGKEFLKDDHVSGGGDR